MGNIINIKNVDPINLEFQEYLDSDNALISNFDLNNIVFDPSSNKIEYYIFDANKNLIFSEYNFKRFNINDSNVVIDPQENINFYGFEEGQFYTLYNFIRPLFNSDQIKKYFISEISSDRTELRLSSNLITTDLIKSGFDSFISSSNTLNYYNDFNLNFGNNNLIIANNVLFDSGSLLVKLYEPLSNQFDIKSDLWVINKISDSIAYSIELITVLTEINNSINLRGPNLNISVKDRTNNSTGYLNLNLLQNSPSASLSNQLNNILNNKSIRLNIDYSNYNNFIHYSSAETRLENFVYKLSLIDSYNQSALSSSFISTNYYLTSSQNVYLNKIQNLIEGFDGYEYYLYFTSGSTSWPKSNSTLPFVNYPSTSSQGTSWLSGQLDSSSLFDSLNKDALINSIPSYLLEDPQNNPYELYVEMLGQHFDILFLYYGEITNKYNSDNRINFGSSRDLISDILRDFGIKIYQNNFSTNDLYSSFLGITPNFSLLPPTGSDLITNYVTASNSVIPLDDVNSEIYKRIYHNLPLLLKKKGTIEGLRLLINIYGISDTVLRINEFGGKNRNNFNDWDQFQNQFNYAFYTTSSAYLKYNIPVTSSLSGSLSTVEFRFRTSGIPQTSSLSQSLAYFSPDFNFNLVLEYTGSGYNSGSYSSSVVDPYNQYGTLKLIDNNNNSASLYLPFFNGDWWSVMVNINNTSSFTNYLYSKNKIYDGYDGKQIGFQSSSSISGGNYWVNTSQSFYLSYSGSKTIAGKNYVPFSGSFQELRFYSNILSESIFNDFVMNPYSIENNQINGSQTSLNSLIFRAPLGTVLDNNNSSSRKSIHPSINSYPVTESFGSIGSSIYTFTGSYSWISNNEIIYFDQFPSGIKNIISNKINIVNNILPDGNVLSSLRSIQQDFPISQSYTRDINYLEVAFSPQNEINEDIISQLGYFNIGDYIGDPRQLINNKSNSYPDFNKIRDDYFKKYSSNFKLKDYIRLIKYFDNSLFKLIKDFIPARTSLTSGVIIKQHLLERNKYPSPQVSHESEDYSSSIKSFPYNYSGSLVYKVRGGNSGMFPNLGTQTSSFSYPGASNITQSYLINFKGPTGISLIINNSQEEFFNGELNGSRKTVTTQSLNNNIFLSRILPTSSFTGSNYDILYGNIDSLNNSQYYQKVEYVDYNINSNYFQRILSGSATFANVKDYYYLLKRHIYPRYVGSKNTSDDFNTTSIDSASLLQQNLNINLHPSFQQGVAYKYDTTIYEFSKGSNPPELPNFSRIIIDHIINTDTTESAQIINRNDDAFYFTKDNQIIPGTNLHFNQYGIDQISLKESIVYSTLLSPEVAAYALVTSSPVNVGGQGIANFSIGTPSVNTGFTTNVNQLIYTVVLDNTNNQYTSGSVISSSFMGNDISSSLANGDDWYITYISGSLTLPFNASTVFTSLKISYIDPSISQSLLTQNGVLQIFSSSAATNVTNLWVKVPGGQTGSFHSQTVYNGGNGNNIGALVWKNKKKNNTLLFTGSNMNNLNGGNFVTQNVSTFIQDNLNDIVKNFGNKPKN